MPNTTNFNFPTPADTDLVKDGASAIRSLGNSIDTAFVDLKGGTTGQVLSKASNTDLDYTWVTTDDANAIQNAIVDAKGDLIAASAADTPARLAVGNPGETLVADSSQSTGLRWAANYGFTAGKNKIINGDCLINQRNFSSGTTQGQYIVDRFQDDGTGGTLTSSVQQFTAGTAPVAGYEAKQYVRLLSATQSAAGHYYALAQNIEDVRVLAGQTATVSFWAKAASGTPNIGVTLQQNFGSGGSATVTTSAAAVQAISTSWARYSFQVSVPSISGKTIGTSSFLRLYIFVSAGTTISGLGYPAVGLQNNTFDLWGVQVEAGSVATAFQTATGTLAGELAACQRYYARIGFPYVTNNAPGIAVGRSYSTTNGDAIIPLSVPLRAVATSVDYSGLQFNDQNNTTYALSAVSLNSNQQPNIGMITMTSTGMTANRMGWLIGSAGANTGYIGFSAEL